MKKKKKFDAERAIRIIAKQEGKTIEYIRSQMTNAMLTGLNNPDLEKQARWKLIPCKGEIPTPEELITYLALNVNAGINPFD